MWASKAMRRALQTAAPCVVASYSGWSWYSTQAATPLTLTPGAAASVPSKSILSDASPHATAADRVAAASSRQSYTGNIRTDMESLVHRIQDEICNSLSRIDGKPFLEDIWTRPGGGGGRSRVLQGGNVFEKAGVNVSVVSGHMPKAAALQMLGRKKAAFAGDGPFPFYATGVSLVIHPINPMAPTMHANFRLFEVTGKNPETGADEPMFWFGGGSDLSPSYLFEDDAVHFHQTIKKTCDRFDLAYYPKFKRWCDEYFVIAHRGEARGVGGFFFDDLAGDGVDPYSVFPFIVAAAESVVPGYVPIVQRRYALPYTQEQKRWQQVRRGRYVEFNLVYDRGTKFGLAMPGSRVESILMSLPQTARWEYNFHPSAGTLEANMEEVLRHPRDWVPIADGLQPPRLS